jgi:protein TonB
MPQSLIRAPDYRLRDPQLAVAWEPRRRNFAGSVKVLFGAAKAPKEFQASPYFRDSWVRSPLPKRALLASTLWHIALFIFPFPLWRQSAPRTQLTLPQIEVTWYGPVGDLPPISPAGPAFKPSPPGEPHKPVPRGGADAFHPRQTIISAPERLTHPRQTLIQPDAPPGPPKILPQLPNVVQWAAAPQPPKPRLQISREALAKLRPKRLATRPLSELPVPEVPNLEKQAGELNIASNATTVPKPQLPIAPTSVPRAGPRQVGQDTGPAPDIRPDVNNGEAGVQRLIALSATPVDSAANLPIPAGNLAARLLISPEGTQPGVPGGSPNGTLGATGGAGGGPGSPGGTAGIGGGGNGSGPPGVSINGGNPNAASGVSGLGAGLSSNPGSANPVPVRVLPLKMEPRPAPANPGRTPPMPGFERIKPGAAPEEIFGPKQVYTLHVNMPNLASVTGSWVLSFVELRLGEEVQNKAEPTSGDLSGPVPLLKVDPKYPPSLMRAKVEGEVVLYAVIRKDGSVDSIQLVKGIDSQLDLNAMEALARWKFRPAERKGAPVELEAIVHIPFRAVAPLY